jgi:uncharacterized protein
MRAGSPLLIRVRRIVRVRVAQAWFLSVTVLAGCASAPPEPACDLRGVVPSEAGVGIRHGQGVLWRVEREGAPPSHVFGTMHAKDPEVTRLAEPVATQFAGARSLAVEVLQISAAVRTYGRAIEIPEGDLELLIGPERMRLVKEAGARYGMPEGQLRRLKPWVLSVLFSMPPREVRDGRPTLDQVLEQSAQARAVPVYGLETIEEQIDAYDRLDFGRQTELLDAALAENWRIGCWWEQVIKDSYLRRDTGTLYALMAEQMADDDVLWRALISDRNLRMAERMEDRLVEGNAFVAVGAAHLPGDFGVLSLLEERGYRISRIY